MKSIEFIVLGEPAPQGSLRIRFSKGRPRLTSQLPTTMPFRQQVGWAALRERADAGYHDIIFGRHVPIAVTYIFYVAPPQKLPAGRIHPSVVPDLDKFCRSCGDALSGIVYCDDAQIVDIRASKRYGLPPRVSIKIEEVSE